MIQAAIFDLDGTLVNIPIDYDELFGEIRKILKKNSVQPLLETISKAKKEEKIKIFKIWDKLESAVLEGITAIREGKAIYKKFCEKPKALITMQSMHTVEFISKHFGMSFDTIVTREDSLDRAEQLQLAISRLGLQNKDALFIGNTDYDSEAAKKVGCQFLKVRE